MERPWMNNVISAWGVEMGEVLIENWSKLISFYAVGAKYLI